MVHHGWEEHAHVRCAPRRSCIRVRTRSIHRFGSERESRCDTSLAPCRHSFFGCICDTPPIRRRPQNARPQFSLNGCLGGSMVCNGRFCVGRAVPTKETSCNTYDASSPTPASALALDDYHSENAREEAVQDDVARATPSLLRMIATDADNSHTVHTRDSSRRDTPSGRTTPTGPFENSTVLCSSVPSDHMGRTVCGKEHPDEHQRGPAPRGSFSMLVMMSTEYIVPVASLVHLLAHLSATGRLNLFWELTDRLWCCASIYHLHSGYLDETCEKYHDALAPARTAGRNGRNSGRLCVWSTDHGTRVWQKKKIMTLIPVPSSGHLSLFG